MRDRRLHADANQTIGIIHRFPGMDGELTAAVVGVAVISDVEFGTMVHQSLNCVKQRMLAANRNNRFIALVSRTEILCMAQNNGIFQFDYPADCGVPCEVVVDRGNGRVLHMLRCGEMRLAQAEVNHLNT